MTEWHKSSFSGSNTNCVEIAATPDQILVRDSKSPTTQLTFPAANWHIESIVNSDEPAAIGL